MAKAFNLTAELNLRGPSNLKQLAASIRRELGTIDANVNVKIDRGAERSIVSSTTALNRLNRELQTTATASATSTNNITNLVAALNSLSGALSGSNNSMQRIVATSEQTVQQMSRIKKNTAVARDEMEEFGRQSALAVRRFAAFNFATSIIYGFYNATSKALGEFIEFDRQLIRLTQITGESYSELSRITETITGLSTGLGVASSDLIRISDTLAQAGLSARETDQALKALALTALAPSFDDLNNTVEGSIALMRQFKIGTDQLAGALGSINAVAAGFAVEASDIITAIQRTGGVFAAASKGVSEGTDALNEFIAVFTSVRATTRESAETIATGLRTIFTRIQREDTIQALKEYGVNLLDVQGKFVGAYKAVQLLSEGLGKLDPRDVSFSRIVEELGGFRQIGKVLPLIQEFSTAQQALAVAQRGQDSLTADAAKAQGALSVQFSKTRESFVALIRDIGNSDSFKTLISLGLTLANTFIKVADFAKPLLPILTTIAAIKGAKALTSFVGGFVGGLSKVRPGKGGGAEDVAADARANSAAASITDNSRYLDANTTALNNLGGSLNNLTSAISPLQASIENLANSAISQLTNEIVTLTNSLSGGAGPGGPTGPTLNSGGIVRKFATGGVVPGSGNRDTVPAMLTPGEFVVNKKAAKAIGTNKLHAVNRYAGGGMVGIEKPIGKTAYDGDTTTVEVTPSPQVFTTTKTRLLEYDAFEVKGGTPEEKAKGKESKDLATTRYQNKDVTDLFQNIPEQGTDKNGRFFYKDNDFGDSLVEKGLAIPYSGSGQRATKKSFGGLIEKFATGGKAGIDKVNQITEVIDGDTFRAEVTPTVDPFEATFRLAGVDTFETRRSTSKITRDKYETIKNFNKNNANRIGNFPDQEEASLYGNEIPIGREAFVARGKVTAYDMGEQAKNYLTQTVTNKNFEPLDQEGGFGRYLAKPSFNIPEEYTTGRYGDTEQYALGGSVIKLRKGGPITIQNIKGTGKRGFGKQTISQIMEDTEGYLEDDDSVSADISEEEIDKIPDTDKETIIQSFLQKSGTRKNSRTLQAKINDPNVTQTSLNSTYNALLGPAIEEYIIQSANANQILSAGRVPPGPKGYSSSTNVPIDAIIDNQLTEIKFKKEPTLDEEILSKLLRYNSDNGLTTYGKENTQFAENIPGDRYKDLDRNLGNVVLLSGQAARQDFDNYINTEYQPANTDIAFRNTGGIIKRFMAGGSVFGMGETKFPSRIRKKYAEEKQSLDERLRAKLAWDPYPDNERITVEESKVQEAFQRPFDRTKFIESFKEKISRNTIFSQMADFAKFIGLPQEELSRTLPLQLDFGGSEMGIWAAASFQQGARGSRPYEGYDLSRFGYGEAQKQEAYGLQKLIEAKQKEIKKIRKTPVTTFDDGSFSIDNAAYGKADNELRDLKNKLFKLENLKREAQKNALDEQQQIAASTGRGTVSFAAPLGRSATTKNDIMYHELTHQLFKGLKNKSADSFEKYKERVVSLFAGDNNELADAFDALSTGTDGGYTSADVVYGRSYKMSQLQNMLMNFYRQGSSLSSREPKSIPEDITKNISGLSKQGDIAKKAREFRPINPKVNEALLTGPYALSQEVVDRLEDAGKEEFLTTLIQKLPVLDTNLQSILDNTLTELLSGSGIKRQAYNVGGTVQRFADGGGVNRTKSAKVAKTLQPKTDEPQLSFPDIPTDTTDQLRAAVEEDKKRNGTSYMSMWKDSIIDRLNSAYKGVIFPGSKPTKDAITPDTIISVSTDDGYIDVAIRTLENDLKYINSVTNKKEGLVATKNSSVGDMLDSIRAYQAFGLDSAINEYASIGKLDTKLGSILSDEDKKKYAKIIDRPLSFFSDALDSAMQFNMPRILFSGLGASKQKLLIDSAGVSINSEKDIQKLKGKTVSTPSFLSSSDSEESALTFSRTGIMRILTNKKRKGLDVNNAKISSINREKQEEGTTLVYDDKSGLFGEQFADDMDFESEYIFPRNTKFKVLKVKSSVWNKDKKPSDTWGIDWDVKQLKDGGIAQRKVGYIDYDVISNPSNEEIIKKGMQETGTTGPRLYADYLTQLAVKARKESSIEKLRAIYGAAGSGKTTLARGQGTDDAILRKTERFPILTPDDVKKATEILVLSSSVSKDKLDEVFSQADRTYTLSSTTKQEKDRVRSQRAGRDVTGVGLEGRKPGVTSNAATDTAVGEALLSDRLGAKSVVLGRTEAGGLRRKRGNELVEIVKKKIGFTWGGFAPMTAGHESIMDAAAAMGYSPEDFLYLVGANEGITAGDPSSYRTAIFDQDARTILAKAGAGAKGATVLPKPRDFEVPQAFDISEEQDTRRKVLIPAKGSRAFVADKTPEQTKKYKDAGYAVTNLERTGGISGTMVRDLIMSGDMAQLQEVLSPGVYEIISNNISRLQNRANALPAIIEQVKANQGVQLTDIETQIRALGISRIDSKKVASDPEYAAKVEVLQELRAKRDKIKSAASFEPYRLLDDLAKLQPEKYGLDLSTSATTETTPIRTVRMNKAQKANIGGLIRAFAEGEDASSELDPKIVEETKAYGKLQPLILKRLSDTGEPVSLTDAIKQVMVKQLSALGGAAGVASLTPVPPTFKLKLRKDNIEKGLIDLKTGATYISSAMEKKGVSDAAEAERLEEYKAKAMQIGIAGLAPLDYKPKEFEWTNIDDNGTDVYAIARVFDKQYMQAAINMQRKLSNVAYEAAAEFQDIGIFGGGTPLAIDFDDTLVQGAEILKPDGKPDVMKYTKPDLVKEALKKGKLTRLGLKLKTLIDANPDFIKQTRILTARPKNNEPLVASALQSLGLPYTESMITGVGGPGVSDVAKAKATNLDITERLIDDNLENVQAAQKSGKQSFQYSELRQSNTELDNLMGQGNLEGAATEKALAILGAPIRPDAKPNRAIDYPDGLGPAAQFFTGLPSNIPTEVKRTIDGSSLEKVREEIRRYITEDTSAQQPQTMSLGGIIQRFAVGGQAKQTPAPPPPPPPPSRKADKTKSYESTIPDDMKPIAAKWPVGYKIAAGDWIPQGSKSIGVGQFAGDAKAKTDFGGSGWKMRLDPKKDNDNILIADWFGKNKQALSGYKIAINTDKPIWTAYTEQGSLSEIQKYAKKAETDLGKFIQLNEVYDSPDTIIPGTQISGRFEIRGDERSNTPRAKEIVQNIVNRRKSSQYKNLYALYKKSPTFTEGFPSSTSGYGGIPGTYYYQWLTGQKQLYERTRDSKTATMYADAAKEEISFIESVLKGNVPEYTGSAKKFASGGISKFASGGTVPALLTPGEAVIGPKLAKKIGYGRLRKMNHAEKNGIGRYSDGGDVSIVPGSGNSDTFGPVPLPVGSFVIRKKATKALGFNKGGAVGIQRFAMGGEVLTGPEINQVRSAIATALSSLPKELQNSIRDLKLPEPDTSSWDAFNISLSRIFRGVDAQFDTLGKDVVEAVRFMTGEGRKALSDIELERARTQQSEIASNRGYSKDDISKMKEDVSTASEARGAVLGRKRKNNERVQQGKDPFPELDLMETMRAAVGRRPNPISITASTPTPPVEAPPRDVEYYRQRMNYSDVSGKPDTPISDSGMKYAEELTKQDSSKVDALVQQMRDMFSSAMSGIGQAPSAAGKSESWATWDIGKQLFMNQNPDQSSDKYKLGNPMQDPKLVLQMVQRMVGYEVTGGGQRGGKANNIPSFELVEIGAKAMAESLGKNQAALDAFLDLVSGITAQDIVGTTPTGGAPASPPTAPSPPAGGPPPVPAGGSPPTPPPSPAGAGGSPPTPPPTPPGGGSPPSGDAEAMVQRYMMELEAAAKAVKLQTYQAERLAGATASEAKARADAAAFAEYQSIAQQRLTTATNEERAAIDEARSRMSQVRGGATVSPAEAKPVTESLARGGAPAPDTTDYRKVAQDNIQSLQEMNTSALAWSASSVLAIKALSGIVGPTTAFGSALSGVSNSVASTEALFLGLNKGLRFVSDIGVSEDSAKKIEEFSSKLIDAGRTVNNWAAKLPDGLFKNIASKLGGGLDLGGGALGKLGSQLPKVISGVTSSLMSILPTAQLVVTGMNAAAQAFIAYTDAIRNNKIENATKSLDTSLKNASSALDMYNTNTIDNANQLSVASAEISRAATAAKTLADIDKTNQKWSTTNLIGETLAMGGGGAESRAQRAEILDKKGMGAYVGSLLDFTGGTQQRYTQELAPQQAIKSSEQFAKVATLIQQQNEARFNSGESSSDIMNSPEWAQQAEVLARANAATEERLRLIDADISLSKAARDARKQELIQFAATGAVRNQEIQAIREANNNRANQESNSLLYGLERMLQNMEQSISSVTYSLNKLADQTDLLKSSMTGEAKIGATRVDAINTLQNPNVSSDVERAQSSKMASQFFGSQGKDIEGLLNFGPKLEETVLSTINRTIKEDPNAGSGKIEARITQNLERELGNLNIDAGLKQALSKQTASAITESRKKDDDKTDFKSLFSETAAFGKVVQATKRAQEAAVKALEFYQQSVSNYAQSMNEMVSLQISSNEKFRRASEIRSRGEIDLAKTLGKNISFETSKQTARAGVMSQAGTTDPTAIFNNIGRLEQIRQGQQGALNSAVQGGPRNQKDIIAFNRELASTTMGLRENYSALKGLAESTDVAQAAMTRIGELKAKNEAGANILERFVTSSPKDQAKLSGAFDRLERNMNGQTNNMWDSVRVQEAYNDAIQNGASMQEAQDAADSAAAQDRGDTLEAFKMLAPMLGENQGELKANMLESMMRESGVETSPMFAKVLEGLRNPEGDPQMAEAINQYRQATELQAQANTYLAMLDGRLAVDIGQQSQAAFTNALNGVGQAFANTNSADISKGINELNNHLRSGVTKVSDVGGGNALPFARGGVVEYRAVGGSIFKPKGTDTVPAMLTPGEFVVNKQAASANKSLLTAINNGYAKGGSVKYLAEGGWVSDMLVPEKDRFGEAKPGELYTKWDDFSKFGSGNDVKANIEKIKADSKDIYFYKPHSYPTFSGRETDSSELLSQLRSGMDGDNSFFGFLPDFSMDLVNTALNIAGATGAGVASGALGGAAAAANPAQFVTASLAGNMSQGQNTAGTLLGNGAFGTAASWIWEAMKFVPGLGGVISGIDAFKKLVFDYDLIGGGLEALNAVFSLIPFPGASLLGKGVSKGLGWMLRMFGQTKVARFGKTWIPKLIEVTGATKLMNTVKGWLGQGPANLVEKLLPDVVKKKLGINLAGAGKSGAELAREGIEKMSPEILADYKAYRQAGMAADEALARAKGRLNYVGSSASGMQASAAQAAARNASDAERLAGRATINNMAARVATGAAYGAGAMGTVGAVSGYMQGRTPSATMSGADKLKSITEVLGFKIPDKFRSPETTSKIFDENLDNLALSEAQMQLSSVEMWLKAIDEANKWSETNKPPKSKASYDGSYHFTSEPSTKKEYMYATIGEALSVDSIMGDLKPNIMKFYKSGNPTLSNSPDPNQLSAAAESFIKSQGRDFDQLISSDSYNKFQNIDGIKAYVQDYYDSLKKINTATTTPESYNTAHWSPAQPSKQKEGRISSILGSLQAGTRYSYDFKKSELAKFDKFQWGSTAPVPTKDGEKPAENKDTGDMLTVYGTEMRAIWSNIRDTENETIKEAIKNKNIWDGKAENAFRIYKQGSSPDQYDPLPWTTNPSLITDGMRQLAQQATEDNIASTIGLKMGTVSTYDKVIDLPKAKRELPVTFSYQPFQQIPLLDPATTDIESEVNQFLPGASTEPSPTPVPGVFIKYRGSEAGSATLNPFAALTPGADKLMPYYSSVANMEKAVNEWALANFDTMTDWSLLGVSLAAGYSPIKAEAAMKMAESIRGARTKRKSKEGSVPDKESPVNSATEFLFKKDALFYQDDFLSAVEPSYPEAANIIGAKIPNLVDIMQRRAARQIAGNKDAKKAEISAKASLVNFKSDEIPLLGDIVWQNVKNLSLSAGPSLSSAADWQNAATADGVAPPTSITGQDDLLAAVDYIAWIQAKVLRLKDKAVEQNKIESVENLQSEAEFGKYMSAGRFLSQLASDSERPVTANTSIGQASERLYSKYMNENKLDQYIKKSRFTDKDSKKEIEQQFWDIHKIIQDKSFVDYILGFANQSRTAKRFKQVVTGNGRAELGSEQKALLQGQFAAFGQSKSATAMMGAGAKEAAQTTMKVASADGIAEVSIPTEIDDVINQFLDTSKVYEPLYRETLGKLLETNGRTYADKWTKSGDPGSAGWSSIWDEYSAQLSSLTNFLVDRDRLLMRPIAEEGSTLYPPAVLPSIAGNLFPTLQAVAQVSGIAPPADVTIETLMEALGDRAAMMAQIQKFIGAVSPTAPEDYEKRDQMKKIAKQAMDFYENNLSPSSLPRVFTQEGNELWQRMQASYMDANKAYMGFGADGSDVSTGLGALEDIYNPSQMPYAQNTLYGLYYRLNKKAGTNNTVEALMNEKAVKDKAAAAGATPKPETQSQDVPAQAAAAAPKEPEPGLPPEPSKEEAERKVQARAKGGLIYRAGGGSAPINWTPRGTDTVPAMLTPGEYVINRGATQKYLPILEAINNGSNTQGAIASAVQGSAPATSYASRGGVIQPKYFRVGGDVTGGTSGVSTSYSMGFDSATLAAIKQFDNSVQALGDALAGLQLGNIKIDQAALSALGDFATRFDQFAQSLLKLNVPPVISITGQHEVNVNINGTSVFSNMEEKMKQLISQEVDKAFTQLSKETEGNITMNYKPPTSPLA